MKKNILCFGDSNTYGFIPASGIRFNYDERWTGILQNCLGQDYYIIEEGCNARTVLTADPINPYKNSRDYIYPCLVSHCPLDLVIICLGANDLKTRFGISAKFISLCMKELVRIIRTFDYEYPIETTPQILIAAPIRISEKVIEIEESSFDLISAQKSVRLATYYEALAKEINCHFFDMGKYAKASDEDGIHLTKEGHKAVAQGLLPLVKDILK
ncbi:MAG: SGNH/GDSL hydrolase family protein [Elusimicrobiota bacterium]|jgi:lysophospholipase L1-like esterase|nr:SGNH/GDSL hydrolase family protein [Elusimicrobiota bacterium]